MLEESVIQRVLGAALRTGGDFAEVFVEDKRSSNARLDDGGRRAGTGVGAGWGWRRTPKKRSKKLRGRWSCGAATAVARGARARLT